MMKPVIPAIGIFTLLIASNAAAITHVALVVGSNQGDLNEEPLRYGVEDARRVAAVLLDAARAKVTLVEEPTTARMQRALENIARQVRQLRASGKRVLLSLYYAGHADDKMVHLRGEHYTWARVRKQLSQTGAHVTMLVSDACRGSGKASTRGLQRVRGPEVTAFAMPQPSGTIWIHATSSGHGAQESERLRGGVFTHYWISALRGAADTNADGTVTLAEAYAYAASHTHGYSAAGKRGPQWPAYRYRLAGARDLVLARSAVAPSVVQLPAGMDTVYVIRRWPLGETIVEVAADPKATLTIGLPTGRFEVIRRIATSTRVAVTKVHLPWGGEKVLQPHDFDTVNASADIVVRGGSDARQSWWLSLGTGIALESNLPLAWQRVALSIATRFAGKLKRLRLAGALAWQGRNFDVATPTDVSVRADSLLGDIGAAFCFDIGPATAFVGALARLELLVQREHVAEPDRYAAAQLATPSARTTLRVAGLTDIGVMVPLFAELGWLCRIAVGAALQRTETDGISAKLLFEATTGPLWVW